MTEHSIQTDPIIPPTPSLFDITAFGAVGDGHTDCTAAIQAALDEAARVEGVVLVPPGKYCTGKLKMGVRTRLQGYSGWNYRQNGLSTLILNDPQATCLLDITGAFGCTVTGICLDGRGLGEGVHGIYLYWERYNGGAEEDTPTIDDCRIGHFTGNGVHLEHIWCFSLRHSMLHNNRGTGLYIDGWDAFILDNWFSGNRQTGILGGPVVASVTATGNRVEWNGKGGFWFKNGDSVNLTGNFFDRSFGPAIKLGDGGHFRDCAITGNVFRRSGCADNQHFATEYESCHVYLDGVSNTTLVGNTFAWGVDDTGHGTRSPDYNIYMANADAVVVQSNVMKNGAVKGGIVYDGQGDNIIQDNLPV